jgi:hypothetical protein
VCGGRLCCSSADAEPLGGAGVIRSPYEYKLGIGGMTRCHEVVRFCALLDRLEEQAGGKRTLSACWGRCMS